MQLQQKKKRETLMSLSYLCLAPETCWAGRALQHIQSHTVQPLFQASTMDTKPVKDGLHSDSNYIKTSESTLSSIQTQFSLFQ